MNKQPIVTVEELSSEEADWLYRELVRYNRSRLRRSDHSTLTVSLRDDKHKLIGGLVGEAYWEWLYVGTLWVGENWRGQGYGAKLLAAAEAEARARGCRHAYLDTFSFQNLKFYQNRGYVIFGELENFPPGQIRYFLRKEL